MGQKFQASVHERGDVRYVKLGGVIDEDNELSALGERLVGSGAGAPTPVVPLVPVVIDLADVERINSCGVRDWVNWLGRVEKGGAEIVMVECSPAIVAQINLVHNFTGAGAVKSFFAPYYCPSCDLEKALLCEARDLAAAAGRDGGRWKAPSCRCDECDGVMDFDDMEESYFAFLANAKRPPSDARVEAVIEEFTPSEGDRKLRVRSSVPSQPPATPSPGTGPGSLPSVPSLPPLLSGTRTPSSHSGPVLAAGSSGLSSSSQRWPLVAPDDLSRRVVPPPGTRSLGPWLLVGVLVAAAVGLLGYVFFAGPTRAPSASTIGAPR